MQQKTQHQHPDQNIARSSTPRRVSSQNATTRRKMQLQQPVDKTSLLLRLAGASRQVSRTAQVIIGIVAVLIVIGIFTLFIVAAVVPNAYIGMAALLSSVGSFMGGFFTGKAVKKYK